jgi:preprotein translocase subunit SecA
VIPTNRPVVREDQPDRLYATLEQKDAAVVEEVATAHETGRPVLIGTLDIAESERLSELLTAADLPHVVLNAKNDAEEAAIVAEAGALGAITVSTQMAGRGTDIRLGGRKAEAEAKAAAEAKAEEEAKAGAATSDEDPERDTGSDPGDEADAEAPDEIDAADEIDEDDLSDDSDADDADEDDLSDDSDADDEDEDDLSEDGDPFDAADKIAELGGLYVIGTGRHPSRRLDDQLRGRAGRQGDPGGSVFFVSMQDELITRYAPDTAEPRHVDEDGLVTDNAAQSAVGHAQRVAEGVHLEIHRNTFRYNKLIDDQRRVLLEHRDLVLNTDAALVSVGTHSPEQFEELSGKFDEDVMVRAARQIMLYHLDRDWADHIATLAEIREGIHLRALGHGPNPFIMSLDPLTEFHAEAVKLFGGLVNEVEEQSAETFKTVEITDAGVDLDAAGLKRPSATWTYLVQDNPFGTAFDRAMRWLTGRSGNRS